MTDATLLDRDDPQFDVHADLQATARKQRRLRARYFGQPRAMRTARSGPALVLRGDTDPLLDGIDFGPLSRRPTETEPPSAAEIIEALDGPDTDDWDC